MFNAIKSKWAKIVQFKKEGILLSKLCGVVRRMFCTLAKIVQYTKEGILLLKLREVARRTLHRASAWTLQLYRQFLAA